MCGAVTNDQHTWIQVQTTNMQHMKGHQLRRIEFELSFLEKVFMFPFLSRADGGSD